PDEAAALQALGQQHQALAVEPHSTLRMSPRRPRKTKTWPQNGFSVSAVCTTAARPSKPFLMSVWPATIHTRVFDGRPIMRGYAAPGARRARWSRRSLRAV